MVQHRVKPPWFVADPEAYDQLRSTLRTRYSTLHAVDVSGKIIVRGSFPVIHDGANLDWYLIEVELPRQYPRWPPIVWEIGGRIPRDLDRHISTGDGSLCLTVPEELWIKWEGDFELSRYLEGPVRTFLISNSLVERGEKWPHGERSHGADGICEFYQEMIGIGEPRRVLQLLRYLSRERIKGHWLCPCGSGRIIRKCHFEAILKLHLRIPRPVIANSMSILAKQTHQSA